MLKRPLLKSLSLLVLVLMAGVLLAACQSQPATPAAESAAAAAPTPAAQEEAAPASDTTVSDTTVGTGGETASAGALTLRFIDSGTEARFLINEVLMGQNKTVVGITSLVEGELTVDPSEPASVQVGEIRIDARGLTTDDDRRTNRLHNDILKSAQDAYRYITFTPTSIEGLPAAATPGDVFTFQATGDLKILDTTQPVTFAMSVTVVDASTVQGTGTATVRYADFGINIPRVPMVASVEDEVILEIDFTAQAGG